MSSNSWNEPFLPWVESQNDRRFKRILLVTIIVFSIFGAIVPLIPVPEVEQRDLKDVAPRLAKLILEKKKQPPPPKPKVEKKKDTKKKPDKKKKAEKKKKPQKKKPEAARKKAEKVGLVALSDDLADLRESFDLSSLKNDQPLQKVGKAKIETGNSAILTSRAKAGSGGINTGTLSRSTGGSELASRKTTEVKSNIPDKNASKGKRSGKSRTSGRGEAEIELVFQKNRGAIYSLYNRARRRDPGLEGKVVLELTIAPSGKVTRVRIVSSELDSPELERKLVSRIKLFRFKAKNVAPITVTYPIEFLPS